MTPSGSASVQIAGTTWSVRSVEIPHAAKGHDACFVGASAAAVVDGATPLSADWPQDVADFARQCALTLVGLADSSTPREAAEIWSEAVDILNERFVPAGYRRSAAAALVRGVGHRLEFSSAGDVQCLVRHAGGASRLMDPTLPRLDEWGKAQGGDVATRHGIRALANTPEGYPIVADDPSVGSRIEVLQLPAGEVTAFWLLSDGCWRLLPDDLTALAFARDAPVAD